MVDHHGTVEMGSAGHGQGQAGIVHLGVVVAARADEPPSTDQGLPSGRLLGGEPAVVLDVAEEAEGVVEGEAQAEFPGGGPLAGVEGVKEGQRADQAGSDAAQDAPLGAGIKDQAEFAVFQVADAAVDQAGGAATGADGEVAPLHQRGTEAAHRGIPRNRRAGDAPADDQDVKGLIGETGQVFFAGGYGKGTVVGQENRLQG